MRMKDVMILMAAVMIVGLSFVDSGHAQRTFKEDQLRYPRVRQAVKQKELHLKQLFADQGLPYPPKQIFIRIFKQEQIVELWGLSDKDARFHLVASYPICAPSGTLGPKRQEGDLQVPEGFYHIDRFNPSSNFHLSLGLNYPNASDRVLGVKGNLGGDVFIHGACVTIGCIPITDDKIKELYLAAVEARSNGQREIPVHIFPARLDDQHMEKLRKIFSKKPDVLSLWENLKLGYDYFEENKRPPKVGVDKDGRYLYGASEP
jgi:murein L,D-transpeptidase YafK